MTMYQQQQFGTGTTRTNGQQRVEGNVEREFLSDIRDEATADAMRVVFAWLIQHSEYLRLLEERAKKCTCGSGSVEVPS